MKGKGSFDELNDWLYEIKDELDKYNSLNPDKPAAPFAINQIVHKRIYA